MADTPPRRKPHAVDVDVEPDVPTVRPFTERHAKDLPVLKELSSGLADVTRKMAVRECRARGKKAAAPLINVLFDTGKSIFREFLNPSESDEDDAT
jgi:hypothetical protein